uniref:Uncharacterized protein n=1 Tax=Proboscia inermis TaxID=420281 RepID=A0A7S0GL71_9STRA|mmetsp:Transcript_46944/g.47404  ORF Transcript_46944/g.47404 Transcript_46944/m.47404 type:complete len:105 (+) Transcript_46944:24-338(+)
MGNTPLTKEALDEKQTAAGCDADPPLIYELRQKGVMKSSFSERNQATKELKKTEFAPGTIGDVTRNPGKYGFSQRTAVTKMLEAGEPFHKSSGFEPGSGCCSIC